MDYIYFVRDKINYRIHFNDFCALNDYKFSTAHDSTVAAILAHEKLIKYIENEINIFKFGVSLNESIKNEQPFHSELARTKTKSCLIAKIKNQRGGIEKCLNFLLEAMNNGEENQFGEWNARCVFVPQKLFVPPGRGFSSQMKSLTNPFEYQWSVLRF